METISLILLFLILFTQYDTNEKLKKILNKDKKNKLDLGIYLNKSVYIILNNENITDEYLFSSVTKTVGKILNYDENWFVFEYYNKNARKTIKQYLKISDLESINFINE